MSETPSPAAEVFGMSDLEERLRSDDGTDVRAAVLSRLVQLDDALGAMVRRGLTQDEFRRAQAVRGAVTAARNFLAMRIQHP